MGESLRVIGVQQLDRGGHSRVLRLMVEASTMESVVLKCAPWQSTESFDPDDPRLWNEWAGLEFLSRIGGGAVTPRFLGGDRRLGFVIMEDLGDHPTLAHVLLGGDEQQAVGALHAYAGALAELHAMTANRAAEYEELRRRFGPIGPRAPRVVGFALDRLADGLLALDPDFRPPAGIVEAARFVDERVASPGPLLGYSPHDCCPDNNQILADGSARLFDLEFGGFRHALLDIAYLHTTMPTCWCVRRLPRHVANGAVRLYRDTLLGATVGRRDEIGERFDVDLAACRAQWAIRAAAGHLVRMPEDDDSQRYWSEWDFTFCSERQLFLFRLEELADAATGVGELAPLAEFASVARGMASDAWGVLDPVPLYPAFGASATSH